MGEVVGALVVFYILGKLLEWLLFKRVVASYYVMVWLSSMTLFGMIGFAWLIKQNEVYAFHPAMFVSYFMAAILLPIIRVIWRKRKVGKTADG